MSTQIAQARPCPSVKRWLARAKHQWRYDTSQHQARGRHAERGAKTARMLMELPNPHADLITRWRGVIERCTGENHSHAQAAAVRATSTSWPGAEGKLV